MTEDDVTEKLSFARRRLDDVRALIARNALSADAHDRQQLIQEFFFHAVGAIDLLAQLVNDRCRAGLDSEDATVGEVLRRIPASDPLAKALQSLHVRTRGRPAPADPYSDDGRLLRLYTYRHHVTHRYRNPFNFVMSKPQVAYFPLDPRNGSGGLSKLAVDEDLQGMLDVVSGRCEAALALL